MMALANDANAHIRMSVVSHLQKKDVGLEVLLNAVRDNDVNVRQTGLRALQMRYFTGRREDRPRILTVIIGMLNDQSPFQAARAGRHAPLLFYRRREGATG